jgi:hypothetical protein
MHPTAHPMIVMLRNRLGAAGDAWRSALAGNVGEEMLTKLNSYSLTSNVGDYPDGLLVEFSESSYQWASAFGMQRVFPNEKFYWAEDKIFLDRRFTEAIVAAINGVVYKISFRLHESNPEECTNFRVRVYQHLVEKMGDNYELKEVDDATKLLIWSSNEGNAILELDVYDTNIILTSSIIRNARKHSLISSLFGRKN